jgi:hypothetical protein
MGAMTSPAIYNKLRARKKNRMTPVLSKYGETKPIIVGCPSCKIGIARTLMGLHARNPVLHTLEWLAEGYYGANWHDTIRQTLRKAKAGKGSAVRVAGMP